MRWILAPRGIPVMTALAAVGLAIVVPTAHRFGRARADAPVRDAPALSTVAPMPTQTDPSWSATPAPSLAGLDLAHIGIDDGGATALTGAKMVAHLTLDPELQRTAAAILAADRLPEAAVVLIDPTNGHVLTYASHVERGEHGAPARGDATGDLCSRAIAPAASVFKIVTAAALVDDAGLGPDTRQCFWGGEQRILPIHLVDVPHRDRWCTTLAGALGRSINTVFARLAQKHLTPAALADEAKSFGFGEPLPFDAPVEASALRVPDEPLDFARTAAGFWNTTLSPLHAAFVSAAIAREGEAVRPTIVHDVAGPNGAAVYTAPDSAPTRRMAPPQTAQALAAMMEHTISEGTCYRAFHDGKGTAFLPGIVVAGKTGTLTDDRQRRFYTWFTGFAPSRPTAGVHPVAIAVLVVNRPAWHFKANVVAREVLRAYFAAQKVPGVTRPSIEAITPGETDKD